MLESLLSWLIRLLVSLILNVAAPVMTLDSVEQVDAYPLYVMHYYGAVDRNIAIAERLSAQTTLPAPATNTHDAPAWGCSLFAAFADPANALYGRNFDWQYSPALLLVNHPPDGYESVAMVDLAYLGFASESRARSIMDLPLSERRDLLYTPYLPFDGMNKMGLAIGMAAVSPSATPTDPNRPTIGSLGIMREVLDHAATLDEAITIFEQFNIDMGDGPPIHYLIADMHGDSALIEFYQGDMVVQRSTDQAWDMATNFIRASVTSGQPESHCWRYAEISAQLTASAGIITPDAALTLLSEVAQSNTQWSVVYSMGTGEVYVAMNRQYNQVYSFRP
ncbi:MAG: linear amide C-N hydrolase [Anaerolineae bacterium]|nr:linear amide C-N hydrolase [Anaerolineae bacterium]